jgi:hypothetical protein
LKLISRAFNGRIIQYFGDGTLSIFGSAIDAVNAAIEIQKELLKEPNVCIAYRYSFRRQWYLIKDGLYGDCVTWRSRIENPGRARVGNLFPIRYLMNVKKPQEYFTPYYWAGLHEKCKKQVDVYAIHQRRP